MWNEVQQALHDSTTQVLTGLARLLPGLLALLVAVLLSVLIASIVGTLVRRALLGVRFDEKLAASVPMSAMALAPLRRPASNRARYASVGTAPTIGKRSGGAASTGTIAAPPASTESAPQSLPHAIPIVRSSPSPRRPSTTRRVPSRISSAVRQPASCTRMSQRGGSAAGSTGVATAASPVIVRGDRRRGSP